jgi:hypothetical protein
MHRTTHQRLNVSPHWLSPVRVSAVSCAPRISFNPSSAGSYTGSAELTDNSLHLSGATQAISLNGSGSDP